MINVDFDEVMNMYPFRFKHSINADYIETKFSFTDFIYEIILSRTGELIVSKNSWKESEILAWNLYNDKKELMNDLKLFMRFIIKQP